MYRRFLVAVMFAGVFISCHKEDSPAKQTASPIPTTSPDTVLLKDIVVPRLPSPYYHFDYDQNGRMRQASFASGLRLYEVVYDSNRISELQNNAVGNGDRLRYSYDSDGHVKLITITNENKRDYRRCFFTFVGAQLVKMEWELDLGAGFEKERTIDFTYYADGNLLEMKDHVLQLKGQIENTFVDRYEQYDNQINKYGFHLIHVNFFDHLLLLPGVQFQKNNAKKLTRTGSGNNYIAEYAYTYDNRGIPLKETGDLLFTSGSDKGKHFAIGADYSYY